MGRAAHEILYLIRHVWGSLREIEGASEMFCPVDFKFVDFGELDVLSRRELEVLALIGEGLSIEEIAERLRRSTKIIETHRQAIGMKLRVSGRVQLVKKALQAGLRASDIESCRIRTVDCN